MSSIYDDLKSKMLQIIYSGLLYVLQEELNILPASHCSSLQIKPAIVSTVYILY